jgi:hypothetical protein
MSGQAQGLAYARRKGQLTGTWNQNPMNPYNYAQRGPPFAPQGSYHGLSENQQGTFAQQFQQGAYQQVHQQQQSSQSMPQQQSQPIWNV